MFKKLVSNLPFSPGLIDQIGFYVKRLRQEELIRRLAMIFTAVSIVVQVMTMLVPPTQAQASSTNNIVYEAVSSKAHLLKVWDNGDTNGNKDIDDIFKFYGVTRSDIVNASQTTMKSTETFSGYELWTMGRRSFAGFEGEFKQQIETNEGGKTTVYVRPWAKSWGSYTTNVLRGTTADGTQFAVIMNCGNLVIAIKDLPEPLPVRGDFAVTCEVISGWAYDPRLITQPVIVAIHIDGVERHRLPADDPNAHVNDLGVGGNHGFSWPIPARFLDGNRHNVAVIAYEDAAARGISEGNQTLTSSTGSNRIRANCGPEELVVCRPGVGLVSVTEATRQDGDLDASECERITICVDDTLVPIYVYEYDGEPTSCPEIQVCRDGVVITIHSNERVESDLAPSNCDEIEICTEDGITVILAKDFDDDIHYYPVEGSCELEPQFSQSKLARNLTQDIANADGTKASPGDVIEYELTTANTGTADGSFPVQENLEDVLEYSTLSDLGGGEFNESSQVLSWGSVDIKQGESLTMSFRVTIMDPLPKTARSTADRASFDFKMNNVYGNRVTIELPKPPSKQVEQLATSLPNTGPAENAFFIGLFVTLVFFFYFRNRLITKELNLIRREFSGA